jgi:hypothetical protein
MRAAMGYAEERLELFPRLLKQGGGPDALKLDGRALRFHIGTSLADVRVPVHLDPEVGAALLAALRDLYFLLCARHRAALRENEYDQLLLLDGFDPRALRPVSFVAPATVTRDGIRRAFLEAPELHPALDSGLVASWISSGRPGRVLVGALNALLRRAIDEGAKTPQAEPTPYLLMLALRHLTEPALQAIRKVAIQPPLARVLQGAVGAGLLLAVRLALREAAAAGGPGGLQCAAAESALHWSGGLRLLPGSGLTCYGAPILEPVPRLDQLGQRLLKTGRADLVLREVAAELSQSKDSQRRAARPVALGRLRKDLLQLLRMADAGRAPPLSLDGLSLAQLFQQPGALERVLASPALRKELASRARAAAKTASNEPARALLESVALAGREWKDDDPGAFVAPETVIREFSTAVTALAIDAVLERALDAAETQLTHRVGDDIGAGHEGGKLYLFGLSEEKPILSTRARAPQMGHLFCDMKDFTKRTAFLKETVVADFLSREFYGPILTAAARHMHGAAHLADRGGIYLNNLLGDAVSFSGDVVSLLQLTQEIRTALQSYGRRLDGEASSEAVARTTAAIEKRFESRSNELSLFLRSATEALRKGTLDPASGEEPSYRIRMLEAELGKLEEERESELSLASGEKLEAGIFVSFGAAPEVATFEDSVFGAIKVSIAEKINESARGTARNGSVRARVDALLAHERARLGKPELVCPLHVSVSQPLAMPITGAAEMAVRRSLAAGDIEGAETVLAESVRDFVAKLASQEASGDRGDIYNGGAAVSEEALHAYVAARGSDLVFLRRDLDVTSLHPSIRARFVFPMPTLRLVLAGATASQSLQELYVHVGRALFKGFEKAGGLGVYEMVAPDSAFFALLAQHHFTGWLRDHENGLSPETGEWKPLQIETGT